MSTELSACKTGMDRTNVTAVIEPLSLYRELLLQPKNSGVLLIRLYFGCIPMRKGLWDKKKKKEKRRKVAYDMDAT